MYQRTNFFYIFFLFLIEDVWNTGLHDDATDDLRFSGHLNHVYLLQFRQFSFSKNGIDRRWGVQHLMVQLSGSFTEICDYGDFPIAAAILLYRLQDVTMYIGKVLGCTQIFVI